MLGSRNRLVHLFLSTPSARRATLLVDFFAEHKAISIHALREEGDVVKAESHPPNKISIHALREEGDSAHPMMSPGTVYFYPRPPRGGRHAG